MPTPKSATRTLADVRAECIALGITPARSIAECEARIAAHRQGVEAAAEADPGRCTSTMALRTCNEIMDAKRAERDAAPVLIVSTPGSDTHAMFAEAFKRENIEPAPVLIMGVAPKPIRSKAQQKRLTHKAMRTATRRRQRGV